jgi:hypothetical protein
MRKVTLSALSAFAMLASPALAGEPGKPDEPAKPMTQKEPTATDVAATPASDLNLKKDEIPPLLIAAQERPYVLRGTTTCSQIAAAIVELNGVLGEDIDVPQSESRKMSAGRVAQSVVGSFIPFRGVIREVSGANAHDRAVQAAVLAGVARRSFLKGIGQGKGCRYPARSATLEVFNARMAALNEGREPPAARVEDAEPTLTAQRETRSDVRAVRYVSRPVVQRSD